MKYKSNLKKTITRKACDSYQLPSTIKTPILLLQPASLLPHAIAILDKVPKFALTHKSVPYMDIISLTEKTAKNLELADHPHKGEKLRQDLSNILHKILQ